MKELNITNKKYPYLLKQIKNPPKKLYILGDENILNDKCISIVGTRDYSTYGEKITKQISYFLAKNGCTIVSGLAKGIDSFAHIGALMANGKTIAVLASGIENIYPKENINLAKQIIENGGAIICEIPGVKKISPTDFPIRNRIISGISSKIIITEMGRRSGAMISADFALDEGRDVFIVPSDISRKNSIGTLELLKSGGKPILNGKDLEKIIKEIEFEEQYKKIFIK